MTERLGAGLSGKVAIVTGAATGIGLAISGALAAHGVRVAMADIDEAKAAEAARSIGSGAFAVHVDVRQRPSVEAMVSEVIRHAGALDLAVANAGVSSMRRATEITDDDWNFNMDVNARGVFLTNQIVARSFLDRGIKGAIVNTASLAAKVGAPLLAHYSASKFAVLGWTQGLAREMAPHGIRVNAVCPGFVRTGMQEREVLWEAELRGMTTEQIVADYIQQTPLGRLEEPEDIAGLVVFLLSDAARFMTGQGINVTGGVYMT